MLVANHWTLSNANLPSIHRHPQLCITYAEVSRVTKPVLADPSEKAAFDVDDQDLEPIEQAYTHQFSMTHNDSIGAKATRQQ